LKSKIEYIKNVSSKRTRYLKVRSFVVANEIKKGEVKWNAHQFLTKPLQGTVFLKMRLTQKNDDLHGSVLEKNNKNNGKPKESKNMKRARGKNWKNLKGLKTIIRE